MKTRRLLRQLAFYGSCIAVLAVAIEACGPDITFRAYLNARLWRPTRRYVGEMANGLPKEATQFVPYAGMKREPGSGIEKARTAYRDLFFDDSAGALNWPDTTIASLRALVRETIPANDQEANELDLLRCKVELRASRGFKDAALPQVRACFENYLAQPRPDALRSEARGWLARTEYLAGRGSTASKYYMEELASPVSNIQRDRVLLSLQMIGPAEDDLEGYFDTPAHALFAVNQVTNREDSGPVTTALISGLEKHSDLFKQGKESDLLALSLMRLSLSMGGPATTLRYSQQVAKNASVRKGGEYNWLVGAARYQQKDYAGAETALRSTLIATDADSRMRDFAANALVGVYEKLNRPIDELWAAFQAASLGNVSYRSQYVPVHSDYFYELWSTGLIGMNFDAAYLLDAKLTEAQLETYLQRYPGSNTTPVRYALAVRHARHEDYAGALKIYEELKQPERTASARTAAGLLSETRSAKKTSQQKMEALYDYADFLAQNEDQIFFNDSLWHRFQSFAFIRSDPNLPPTSNNERWKSLTSEELMRFEQLDRHLHDDQEEYWHAYKILNQIVAQSGHTPLGRKAAERAIVCLRSIRTDRFGRDDEIDAADSRLRAWLAQR